MFTFVRTTCLHNLLFKPEVLVIPIEMQEQEVVWSDITDLFKSASSSLTHKEPMIYHESFSLFEAMSAVEIMDPKMDQRFNLSSTCQNQDDILNLQCHKLSDDFNRQTLASLLKSLIPLEVAYMDGFSVLETTHNCIGLWEKTWNFPIQPENLFWSIFITYCKATNQTINYVKSAILDAEIYEEEDFQPATSGFICSTLNNDDIISSLAGYIVSSQSLDNVPIIIPTLLDFKSSQILLYKVISDWIRFNVQHRNPSRQQLGLGDKAIDFASKTNILIESAREKLGRLQSIDTTPFEGEEESIQSAFSADLIKLVQTTPTRTVLKKPFNDCPTYFATLLDELSQLVTTFKELCAGEEAVDFEKLLQLALGYSRKHFHVLSRSLLKSFFDYFSPQMPALVHRSMKQRGIPLEYIEDELVKVRWSEVICKLAKETLNVLAGNRSKLLVRLDNILGSWGMIGSEGKAYM